MRALHLGLALCLVSGGYAEPPKMPFRYDAGLGPLVQEYVADRDALARRYPLSLSALRLDRMERFTADWRARLDALDPADLTPAAQIDHALLSNHLEAGRVELRRHRAEAQRLASVLPFGEAVSALDAQRMAVERPVPEQAAAQLAALADSLRAQQPVPGDEPARLWLLELRSAIERWRAFHQGYDPEMDWWTREPLAQVIAEFDRLTAPQPEPAQIPGRPVGREALIEDLRLALISNSPEELIAIGEREYAWCMERMLEASRELGYGDDWKAALEHVKRTAVPPGEWPWQVKELAEEATALVEEWVTVPDLAKEVWRMDMMTREAQRVAPFFYGGEAIVVSYPTAEMTHQEKLMSMRGNNPAFSRATVQHELIPGHHLQFYMTQRNRPYRGLFETPFWTEGWTLYWELLLWDRGFPKTPEQRIGMLFWRMHRCVRVVFSLRFHLGELTTAECVDMLVDRVGHERLNAEGEVRRSFNGTYPPLYQAAYLIGGLQFRAISRELQDQGWSLKRVHDAMMAENQMPPAMMRLAMLGLRPPGGEALLSTVD